MGGYAKRIVVLGVLLFLPLWGMQIGCSGTGGDDDTTATTSTPVSEIDIDGDGFSVEDGDCDDNDTASYPGADERCDGADNDCDGDVDENDALDATEWYPDLDADGYGGNESPVLSCDQPDAFVENSLDCNDDDPDVNPGEVEVCDEADLDNDCNGLADDEDPDVAESSQVLYYPDNDGDGDGDSGEAGTLFCDPPAGSATTNTDCDDTDPDVHAGAFEVCDAADKDEDCNGLADDNDPWVLPESKNTFYTDADQDGFGDVSADPTKACNQTKGLAPNNTDCDDTNAEINPAATEVCDADRVDEDCNGVADDDDAGTAASSKTELYTDADDDQFGDYLDGGTPGCHPSAGQATNNRDCDDTDASINPAAPEVCDPLGVDENCNTLANDDDPTTSADSRTTYYHDVDQDKYGSPTDSRLFCAAPSTGTDWWTSEDHTDCDDRDADINPAAVEYCNEVDDDCDGETDEDTAADATTWYLDHDLDGYGLTNQSVNACSKPAGYVSQPGDCDDTINAINPGAQEICDPDNVDEDCDGTSDDADDSVDPSTQTAYYPDADGDAYGDEDATPATFCDPQAGYVLDHSDCNDQSSDFNPGVSETDCADPNDYNCDGSVGATDADGDGFYACEECDDTNPAINPGAIEICDPDDVDEDCNDLADDDDPGTEPSSKKTYYVDGDGDGFGDAGDSGQLSCEPIEDRVADNTDCDDNDPAIKPTATEVCDAQGVDENCNGLADEADPTTSDASKTAYYHDVDQDGYGTTSGAELHCDDPSGSMDWWTADNTDCNDRNDEIYPSAPEECNGIDDNCDGNVDEDSAIDARTWYLDDDGDGYGSAVDKAVACSKPGGYVSIDGDCDDHDATVNPGAEEVCDSQGKDENCNGLAGDDDPDTSDASKTRYFPDADGDGYGDEDDPGSLFCQAPDGYVLDASDCNDADQAYNPGVVEDDCTDPNDYNCDGSTGYTDQDGDGYPACTDCDDENPAINPDAAEICDSDNIDENCNDLADDADATLDATTRTKFYADSDGDGFGDENDPGVMACDPPDGYVSDHADCNDSAATVNPAAVEVCDDRDTDENCNGTADNADATASTSSKTTYYHDLDTDGYGDKNAPGLYCDNPSTSTDWWTTDDTDCSDRNGSVNPGATEVCNGVDDDCDGAADGPDSADALTWYADVDGDGYGNAAVKVTACKKPDGYTSDGSDCNDDNAAMNPDVFETCDVANTDENCNGLADDDDPTTKQSTKSRYFVDLDGDGYGRDTDSGTLFCDPPDGYVSSAGDCNDNNPDFNPAATETCDDPTDYNCDGSTSAQDADGDTYFACEECDDRDASINPAASEICDGKDNDCDGLVDDADNDTILDGQPIYYEDKDGDGYGDPLTGERFCTDPATADVASSTVGGDCDDTNADAYPEATEYCNGVDDDCDNVIDESDAEDANLYYADTDSDGYGDGFSVVRDCAQPADTVTNHDDCDDSDPNTHPGAVEDCSDFALDRNCNDLIGCDDPACGNEVACQAAEVCDNGSDDDGDGYSDCDDPDCANHPACAAPACPDADLGAIDLPLLGYGNTVGFDNDMAGSCGGQDAEELTFSWTAPGDGYYVVNTQGSAFDTLLYAFDGSCDGPELDCNDDTTINGESVYSSELILALVAGQNVVIAVDGFGTEAGDFSIEIYRTEAFECSDGMDNDEDGMADCDDSDCSNDAACLVEDCVDGIDNDGDNAIDCLDDDCTNDPSCTAFACPEADLGSDLPIVATGDTGSAGNDLAGSCGGAQALDYAVSWTAPADGTYLFSTEGSNFDTVLYLLDGGCTGATEIACNDDKDLSAGYYAEVTADLTQGQTVVVAVDGFDAAEYGAFILSIAGTETGSCTDGIDNDGDGSTDCTDSDCANDSACMVEDCSNGIDDDGDGLADCIDDDCALEPNCLQTSCPDFDLGTQIGNATATGSSVGVSNDFASSLCNGGGEAPDVTFVWTAPTAGTYAFDTQGSDFDTILYFLAGSCDGGEFDCNDDDGGTIQSGLTAYFQAGETAIIVVDGYGTAAGNYVLNIQGTESDACDDGTDNDGDGLVDCDDDDCANQSACILEDCSNGYDDDGDTFIDCVDPECSSDTACYGYACPADDLGSALGSPVVTATTVGAGNDLMGGCGGNLGETAEDAAFYWTAPSEGIFTFDTLGSDFDTTMYALADSCSGVSLACNDDAQGSSQSEIELYLTQGQVIVLVVDGYSSQNAGTFLLNIAAQEYGACADGTDNDGDGLIDCEDTDCATSPDCTSEDCSNGIDDDYDGLVDCLDDDCTSDSACVSFSCPEIELGSTVGDSVASGSTANADDTFLLSCGAGVAADVAFGWTAPADGDYVIDTFGSDFDTVLGVLDGTCSGSSLACNDQGNNGTSDQSELVVSLLAGQSIVIVIDGWDGTSGSYVLNINPRADVTPTPAPSAYDFTCADEDIGTSIGSPVTSGTTTGADHTFDNLCYAEDAPDWAYAWIAPATATYTFSLLGTDFLPTLSLNVPYLGEPCPGTLYACTEQFATDTPAETSLALGTGQAVIVIVSAQNAQTGSFTLDISQSESGFCGDFVDNDSDGMIDCDDDDCLFDVECLQEDCTDGTDNDFDFTVDCRDSDCAGQGTCGTPSCLDDDIGSYTGQPVYAGTITNAGNDFDGFCEGDYGDDVAFSWTAPLSTTYIFSTEGSDFPASVGFFVDYGGSSCPGELIGCALSPDVGTPAAAEGWIDAGTRLNIIVDDYQSMGGDFLFSIYEDPNVDVTFQVLVPDNTPPTDTIYLTGSVSTLGEWAPAAIPMTDMGGNLWTTTVTLVRDTYFEYKYTRGSWTTVEKDALGNDIDNRVGFADYTQTIDDIVASW